MEKRYELVVVVSSKASEDDQKKIVADLKKQINSFGKMIEDKLWEKRTLAYPIKKEREAYYYVLSFAGGGKEVSGLTEKLKLNEAVLRYLIVKEE